jgi:hypothetical protein
MALSIKELAVVLIIALFVFKALGPLVQRFASDVDLRRRRFVWCALTAAAFLSPSPWLFAIIAIPLLVFIGKKDSNPAAVYLFLYYAVPPFIWRVPMIGISYLIDLTPIFLLAFCVMSFQAVRMLKDPMPPRPLRIELTDLCILGYVLLTAFYFVLPETSPGVLMTYTLKDCVRRAVAQFITLYVPYFVISRSLLTRRAILDSLASAILAAAVMAAVALFESARHWLLYVELIQRFNYAGHFTVQYLQRGGYLRAMASSGEPLTLAYVLGIAFGLWLSVRQYIESRRTTVLTVCLLLSGLYVTHSRGPWMGAALILLVFYTLRSASSSRAVRAVAVTAIIGILIVQLSGAEVLTGHIPFTGSMQHDPDYLYRVRLFDRAVQIISANPLLGDQQALLHMQDLRQGQGIIDLVNAYVDMLLGCGLVGFSLWFSFVAIGLLRARALSKEFRIKDTRLSMVGVALISCTLGTLFMISTVGGMDSMICVLTGLSIAYARLRPEADSTLPEGSIAWNT